MTLTMHHFLILFVATLISISNFFGIGDEKKSSAYMTEVRSTEIDENEEDYFEKSTVRNEDLTYQPTIKTVLLHGLDSEMSDPIISLEGREVLHLSFDDLSTETQTYNYTLIHCNVNWENSGLANGEYVDGFENDEITDYRSSFTNNSSYIHYSLLLPNETMRITRSGNYVLFVYQNDRNNPVLTKRFLVVENRVNISMNIREATFVNHRFTHQEVDFSIDHTGYTISNPYEELHVTLMQNHRWDNSISGLKPRFVKNNILEYNYNEENTFMGNNEYRNFDTKSIDYESIEIRKTQYNNEDKLNHVYLVNDEDRSFKKHYFTPDLNGKFLIKNDRATESEIESEYVKVHFYLPYSTPINDGNLYLFGKFSDWKFKEELKLDYDSTNRRYTKAVLLKQGYYNYQYCFVKDKSRNVGDLSLIEGSHFDTENDYIVLLYHRSPNDNFDRLIGYQKANSANR